MGPLRFFEKILFVLFAGVHPRQFFSRRTGVGAGMAALFVFLVLLVNDYSGLIKNTFTKTESSSEDQVRAPHSERLDSLVASMMACAFGLRIEIKGDIEGSLRTFLHGLRTKGAASADVTSDFLKLFPERERASAYQLYIGCLAKILGAPGQDPNESDSEFLLYREAMMCVRESCTFERCLAIYQNRYPFGFGVDLLKAEAVRVSSARCGAPEKPAVKETKCVTFNDQEICG